MRRWVSQCLEDCRTGRVVADGGDQVADPLGRDNGQDQTSASVLP
jgi:hypothetical protein